MTPEPIKMDYARREEIFSKDVMTINELAAVMSCSYSAAAQLMNEIKFKKRMDGTLRFDMQGKLHVQDYLEFFNLGPNNQRFMRPQEGQQ